ncbi:MAG: Gar1/Naf1 family protein [Candidatus Thorarchaeota archaeon]
MRRLGKVLHISQQGHIIVQTDKTPPVGAVVVDKDVRNVGRIVDVFGPVKRPYVAIRPQEIERTSKLIGQTLYLYMRRPS